MLYLIEKSVHIDNCARPLDEAPTVNNTGQSFPKRASEVLPRFV